MGWGKRKQHEQTSEPTSGGTLLLDEPEVPEAKPVRTTTAWCIGQSVHVKGDLNGREDIRIEGTIEGSVCVEEHSVAIGAHGRIQADVTARSVTVEGQVVGNITADDRVEIAATGSVLGNIRAGRVVLAEGARFKGSIDMGPVPSDEVNATGTKAAIDSGLASLFGSDADKV